jgi:glycosyltransferase involved in cell wall biosynthesis
MSRLKTPTSGRSRTSAHWLSSRSQGVCPDGSVFLHAPSFAFQAAGGGENQLVQTGRHLEAQGIPVRLFSPWTDRLDRARLLHIFGMSREGLELARCARARGTPVVLSPISWFEPRALWSLEKSLARKLGGLGAWSLRRLVPGFPGWKRELLHLADRVLPNSRAEARQLVSLFNGDPAKISVVPNGVLASFQAASPAVFRERFGDEEFVLFVGRIEPRKNPLGLIRALRLLGLRLVVIGEAPPERTGYLEQCRAAGGDHVLWLPARDHGDPLLASAYAAARIFALPSWFETPGLAALEAALAGTAIVITPHGSTREYFGNRVHYTRPDRVGEIASAIRQAWRHGPDPRLADFIASHYLWPRVAQKTAEVYDQVA